ncbi:MAG: hypothetical protein C6I00_02105 [Nitratiruptor sp.]|nr:hypothetical protein [Nitratiruptor sp.]NPA84083.1 hypothetical protein [Campylobacterota bacterium]
MRLRVLTTTRAIRQLFKSLPDGMVDRFISIEEFFSRAITIPERTIIDEDWRRIFLYRAKEGIDLRPLGLEEEFLSFFKNTRFVLEFWNELAREEVAIEDLMMEDLYGEYQEHLQILQRLQERYLTLLDEAGLADPILFRQYQINESFFAQFEKVELELLGYLSKRERQILQAIPIDVELHFTITPYNRSLFQKMYGSFEEGIYRYDPKRNEVLEFRPLPPRGMVEVVALSQRIWQVPYALASIEELVQGGIEDPSQISIILPDEGFASTLALLNNGNLNFAMGFPFTHAPIYTTLKSIEGYLTKGDPIAYQRIAHLLDSFNSQDLVSFIRSQASPKELAVLDRELYRFEKLRPYLPPNPLDQLHFLLEQLAQSSFDDVEGGKVTVMGVLESRGIPLDGAIILDFNEELVPKVGEGDLFLNSLVRKRVGLPSRQDREALQKHYYAQILHNSKRIKIAYVANEESAPSRFLYELGYEEGPVVDGRYQGILCPSRPRPNPRNYDGIPFDPPKILTPTTLAILLGCTKHYYFRYVRAIKNEIPETTFNFGNHFHETIASLLRSHPHFTSSQQYFHTLMNRLFQVSNKEEWFVIKSFWEPRVRWFCEHDFPRIQGSYKVEAFQKRRELGGYLLTAKFDRLDDEVVIDYKTGRKQKEREEIQALFYNYIYQRPTLFYYLKEKRTKIKEYSQEDAIQKLQDLLGQLEFVTRPARDEGLCRWCDYRFLCKGEA